MKTLFLGKRLLVIISFLTWVILLSAQTTTDQPIGKREWAAFHDLNASSYQAKLREMKAKGMRPVDVEVFGGNTRSYSIVFRQNKDRRDYVLLTGLTATRYNEKWNEMKSKGYRVLDQESHVLKGTRYYGALWIKNIENYRWSSNRNLTNERYNERYNELKSKGYMLIDVDAYRINGALRYSMVWVENKDRKDWLSFRNMTVSRYGQRYREMKGRGYRLMSTESYQNGRSQLYAAIWVKES
ncbi:MAG: hypothetical protein AAF223_13120, partial [Bacteroidota bacterium]